MRQLGHATPEQISDAVPEVDLTTVYRTLETARADSACSRTPTSATARPSYRPAEDDHIHVVCHHCGAVVDVPPGLVDDLDRRLRDERGFRLDRSHLTVFGTCARLPAARR